MDHEDDLQIPESLIEQLKAQDRPPTLITARVDRAVADIAQSQFSTRRPAVWQNRPAWYAAAAAAAVALLLVVPQGHFVDEPVVGSPPSLYADVDGSGRIDIADVWSLAQRSSPASQDELDAFAMRIVSLSPAGDSL